MNIVLDTMLTFDLPGDRHISLDVLELQEFIDLLWETKGKDPEKDAAGNVLQGPDGKPLPRTLPWPVICEEVQKWIKDKAGAELKKSEAMALWGAVTRRDDGGKGQTILEKKRASWLAPAADAPGSPNSPNSSDPRFADD